jgi:hypothetical protein
MYDGLENPVGTTVNESFVPGMIVCPGDMDCIESDGGGDTTMVCVILALLPEASEAVNVKTCVPASRSVGIQVNTPAAEISLEEIEDDVPTESDT